MFDIDSQEAYFLCRLNHQLGLYQKDTNGDLVNFDLVRQLKKREDISGAMPFPKKNDTLSGLLLMPGISPMNVAIDGSANTPFDGLFLLPKSVTIPRQDHSINQRSGSSGKELKSLDSP